MVQKIHPWCNLGGPSGYFFKRNQLNVLAIYIVVLDFFYVVPVKISVEISQNFAAFSEYMNFKWFCECTKFTYSSKKGEIYLQYMMRSLDLNSSVWIEDTRHEYLPESFVLCDNYVPQWWVELENELSWLFINR